MSIETLVCTIIQGYGAVTLYPGIVESPRYNETILEVLIDDSKVTDVSVDGPFDRAFSYKAKGYRIDATHVMDRWIITLDSPANDADFSRETIIINDLGRLLWTQASNASQLNAASASIFNGNCKAKK